ncbi:MAG TPA: TldD/PmbA family protein [Blastocatellia bacterium]|nr:TldD/PmbA family protein [Blastocatellia bacterium]
MRFELTKESAEQLAQEAVRRGASAAEVVMKRRQEFAVSVRLGEVEKIKESTDQGLGLRVLINGQQASVSCSDFSREAVLRLVDEAVELARATSIDESAGLPEASELAREIPALELYDEAVERLTTEEKIAMALRAERAAQSYSDRISNFDGGGLETASSTIVLANSLGFAGQYDGTMIGLATVPVAADDQGRMQRDYWYDTRRRLEDLTAPEAIGRIAAQRTLRKLNGRSVPTQTVPVVFDPSMSASLLGNLFEAASGEAIFRRASFLVGQLGEEVASRHLTVIDDGRLPGKLGSRPFDGEGLPTRRTVLIEQGRLESYLLNSYTARKLGLRSTGNAARALIGAPTVDAGNLYIAAGPHTPAEIIGSVGKGLYLTEMIGQGVNIVTGDYSRSAGGLWIENGELTFAVQGVTVAGNLKEMLRGIGMVGNDLDFRGSVAAPTLLIDRMTISA